MTNTTVSSGVTSSGIALTVGDTMTVLSGGTAIGAVDSGGTVTVSAGGTASGTTVMIGGQLVSGGTAINTGTIPSKTIREAVLHLSGFYYQSIYGVNYRVKEQITMADLSFRAQHVIKTEIDVIRAQLSRNGIEVLTGVASFTDPTHIHVVSSKNQSDYEAANVIIATGTKPAESSLVPFNGRNIINSDQILSMPEVPKTLIVVGGGVIGVEYTCMFATLGVRVILVEKLPRLLEFADNEMVEALSYHLRDSRVTMRLNEEVSSVEETAAGVVAPVQLVMEAAVGPGDPYQREHHGELAESAPRQVPGQAAGGLSHQHDHSQVVEQLKRADNALVRLLAVRAGRLPQVAAQPSPALFASGCAGARLWRARCPGRARGLGGPA